MRPHSNRAGAISSLPAPPLLPWPALPMSRKQGTRASGLYAPAASAALRSRRRWAGFPKADLSHHDNNYAGAVWRLPAIRARKSQSSTLRTAPGFLLNGLKREELIAFKLLMILH